MPMPMPMPLHNKTLRRIAGFTLIELMVTVAIVAVLAAIALPAYTNQIRKSRRGDAKMALLDLAAREERYNTTNFTYTNSFTALGFPAATVSVPSSGTVYYNLSITLTPTTNPTDFTLTATATGDQGNDSCKNFTLTSTGVQALTGSPTSSVADCWK